MDFIKDLASGNKKEREQGEKTQKSDGGGGFMDKLNSLAGGGKSSEKNEDALDKGT